jgi:serine/threonine-protein kinase HipA
MSRALLLMNWDPRRQNGKAPWPRRYDRRLERRRWRRIHQEDLCQAFGLPPSRKYESEGGPGVRQIAELIRNQSIDPQRDVESFAEALAFNWLIAGTDAHAKNYSLLLGPKGSRPAGTVL